MSAGVDIATLGLEVRSDGVSTASERLRELQREGKGAEDSTKKLTAATEESVSSFGNLSQYIKSAALAFAGWKASEAAKEATLFAANVEAATRALQVIGNATGQSSEAVLKWRDKIKDMNITTQVATGSVAQFTRAHMDLSKLPDLVNLAQGAAIMAATSGQAISSSEALEHLVGAIITGNTQVLHQMGIMVNQREIMRDYSKESGNAANSVDAHQRHVELLNAVLKNGSALMALYANSTDLAAKQIASSKRPLEEMKLALGNLFLPELSVAASSFYHVVSDGAKFLKAHTDGLNTAKGMVADFSQGLLLGVGILGTYLAIVGAVTVATGGMAGITAACSGVLAVLRTDLTLTGAEAVIMGTKIGAMGETIAVASTRATIGLMSIKAAVNVLGAFMVGWEIGKFLSNQFAIVRQAGTVAVYGLIAVWKELEFTVRQAWAVMSHPMASGAEVNKIKAGIQAERDAWRAEHQKNMREQLDDNKKDPTAPAGKQYQDNAALIAKGKKELEDLKKKEQDAATQAAADAAQKQNEIAERQAAYNRKIWDAQRGQEQQDAKEKLALVEVTSQRELDVIRQNKELGLISEQTAADQAFSIQKDLEDKKLNLLRQQAHAAYEAYSKTSDDPHTDLLQQMQDWKAYSEIFNQVLVQKQKMANLDNSKQGDDALLAQKQTAHLKELQIQVLETTGHYEEAAKAKADFEKTTPAYKGATDEIRAQMDALAGLNIEAAKLRDLSQVTEAQIQLAEALGDTSKAIDLQNALNEKARVNMSIQTQAILKQVDAIKARANALALAHANDELKDQVAVAQTDPYRQQEEAAERSYKRQITLEKEKYAAMTKGTQAAAVQLERMQLLEQQHAKWVEENDAKKWQTQVGSAATAIGQIGQLMMQGNKDQFEAGKAMMMAQAVISAALAIIRCYTDLGPVGGTIAAVGIGAITAMQIATIADTEYQKKAEGGRLSGGIPGQDSIKVLAMQDEYVIKASAARAIGFDRLDYMNNTGKLPAFANGGQVGVADNYGSEQPQIGIAQKQLQATRDNTAAIANLADTFQDVHEALKDQVLAATNNGLTTNRLAGMDIEKPEKSTVMGSMMNAISTETTALFRGGAATLEGLKAFATLDFKGLAAAGKRFTQAVWDMTTMGWGGSLWGGKVSVQGAGLQMGYQNGQLAAQQYTDLKKSGGLFKSAKQWTETTDIDPQLLKAFQGITDGMVASLNTAGKALGGLTVDLGAVAVSATKLDLRGASEQQASEAIEKWFQDLGNRMASKIGGPDAQKQLASVTHFGETSYQALMRVTMALQAVRDAGLDTGGKLISNAKEVSIANGELSDSLVKAFGGISGFRDAIDKYNKLVNTDEEYSALKVQQAHRQVASTLSQYNVAVPQTVEQFKNLVKNTDMTSPLYASLLSLVDSFDTIKTAADDAAEASRQKAEAQAKLNKDVTSRLFRASGNDTAADIYDLRAQQEQELIEARKQGLNVTKLMAIQTIEYNKTVKDLQTKAQLNLVEAQKAYDKAVLSNQLDIAQKAVAAWKTAADSIKSSLKTLGTAVTESLGLGAQLAVAKADFSKLYKSAMAGNTTDAGKLGTAAETYATAIKNTATSREDYITQMSLVMNKLTAVQRLSENKTSGPDAQIVILQKQLEALDTSAADNIKAAAAALAEAKKQNIAAQNIGKAIDTQRLLQQQLAGVAHTDAQNVLKAVTNKTTVASSGTTSGITAADIAALITELRAVKKEIANLQTTNTAENNALVTRVLRMEQLLDKWDNDGLLTRAA